MKSSKLITETIVFTLNVSNSPIKKPSNLSIYLVKFKIAVLNLKSCLNYISKQMIQSPFVTDLISTTSFSSAANENLRYTAEHQTDSDDRHLCKPCCLSPLDLTLQL